jgi:hypothetical protein
MFNYHGDNYITFVAECQCIIDATICTIDAFLDYSYRIAFIVKKTRQRSDAAIRRGGLQSRHSADALFYCILASHY